MVLLTRLCTVTLETVLNLPNGMLRDILLSSCTTQHHFDGRFNLPG